MYSPGHSHWRGAIRGGSIALIVMLSIPVASELRDPTRPPGYGGASVPRAQDRAPTLRSIVHGSERALALIDNVYMREGERRGGIEILKIYPERVLIRLPSGRERTLTLAAQGVKKEFQ